MLADDYQNDGASIRSAEPPDRPISRWLRRLEWLSLLIGIVAAFWRQSLPRDSEQSRLHFGLAISLCLGIVALCWSLRYHFSRARITFLRFNRPTMIASCVWMVGLLALLAAPTSLFLGVAGGSSRTAAIVVWSEFCLFVSVAMEVVALTRKAAAGGANPSVILVATFGLLIATGTVLLMLPISRGPAAPADESLTDRFRIAFFTSTSASCVTGLVVVPTGGQEAYWSRLGQVFILTLIQIGGLGIMTLSAFFAVAAGRHMPIRERATLRDALDIDSLGGVKRLVLGILGFTLTAELIGAILLYGLWPTGTSTLNRIYFSVFHSISAFCNAGFSLTDNSFLGMSHRWQVFLAVPLLIIVGGLGFGVLQNILDCVLTRVAKLGWLRHNRTFRDCHVTERRAVARLTLTSRLVVITTAALLLAGMGGYLILERSGNDSHLPSHIRLSDAWFQSVTFRTAGFNTVDHEKLQPGTKLFAIALMFVGASPGSTGGGVKTACFALAVMGVITILKGRTRVEFFGRTIPDVLVNRALTIITLGLVTLMSTTLLLTVLEDAPSRFLDHLYEATSAFATVGVSANMTHNLTPGSQFVLIVTMFLGRVGPLTLLVAVAGRMQDERYVYPVERVTLG